MLKSRSKLESLFRDIFTNLLSFAFIPNWILNSSCETFLDVGCGLGLPMKLINLRHKVSYSVGVDLFKPYIDYCKEEKIHNKYLLRDVRELPFVNKSFDVVMAYQLLEHLSKKDALILVRKMEALAKKFVIISTPIGKSSYHADDNILQEHKSFFYPNEFKKLGYKTVNIGGRYLFDGEHGIFYKIKYPFLRKFIYVLDIFLTPVYLLFQKRSRYYFFAYKRLKEI